jgi:serine/threonine-protein kinase
MGESSAQVFALVLDKAPAPPRSLRPDLPAELDALILRCLEKDRTKRVGSAAALAAALTPFAEGAALPPLPEPASVLPRESAAAGASPLPHAHAVTVPEVKIPPRRSTMLSAGMFALAVVIAGAGAMGVRPPAPQTGTIVSSVRVAPAAPVTDPPARSQAEAASAPPPPPTVPVSASAPQSASAAPTAPPLKLPQKTPSTPGDSDPFAGKRR